MNISMWNVIRSVLLTLCCVTPLAAQPAFPVRGVEIINALYAGVDPQNDEARKAKIRLTCEQMAHDLGDRWGGKKRAGLPDDYRSPDSLAFLEDDGSVSVWDIQYSSGQIGVSAGKPPDYPRLPPSEATFLPCAPVNHMALPHVGLPPPTPGPPPPPPPAPIPPVIVTCAECGEILQRVKTIEADVAETKEDVKAVRAGAARVWGFIGRYIVPAVGAGLAGWFGKPGE